MLYLIGLGLGDPSDITVKGLEIVRKCETVFLESYTSIMSSTSLEEMESFFGKKLQVADRDLVEQGADQILDAAKIGDVAFLVIGGEINDIVSNRGVKYMSKLLDPLGATTHTDLVLRARELSIPTQVVHNASILNAIGATGLQLYAFGETVSIPFWTESWRPDSFFGKIAQNKGRGLHTLCLLDIKVKEPNLEAMMRGKVIYEPPRFMTVAQAAEQLLEIVEAHKDQESPILKKDDICVGVARIGSPTQKILACSLAQMATADLGPPLHSLVIPGNMHPLESDFLAEFMRNKVSGDP